MGKRKRRDGSPEEAQRVEQGLPARPRRVFLKDLAKRDKENDTSIVRELEMVVDSAISQAGYRLQFWRDVSLYGIDEAILYVRNGGYGDANEIQAKWNAVK